MVNFEPLLPVKVGPQLHKIDAGRVQLSIAVIEKVFAVCPFATQIAVAGTCRVLRETFAGDEYWRPYLDHLGVKKTDVTATPADATNILECGYVDNSAFKTCVRVAGVIGPHAAAPEEIPGRFPNAAERARVLHQAEQFAALLDSDSTSVYRDAVSAQTQALRNDQLRLLRRLIDDQNFIEASRSVQILEALGYRAAAREAYLASHPLLKDAEAEKHKDPTIYFESDTSSAADFDQERFNAALFEMFSTLSNSDESLNILFPDDAEVREILNTRFLNEILFELIANIFSVAKLRSEADYFDIVPRVFEAFDRFIGDLVGSDSRAAETLLKTRDQIYQISESHISRFLEQQTKAFRAGALRRISQWNQANLKKETDTERFLWSSVPRQTDKKDFVSSFKRMLMLSSPSTPKAGSPDDGIVAVDAQGAEQSRTIVLQAEGRGSSNDAAEIDLARGEIDLLHGAIQPKTEFEAQVAVLISKLQGIESLFSLELTLGLISECRYALIRIRTFTKATGTVGSLARRQAEQLFVDLVTLIGTNHVEQGFERAVNTLKMYDPKKYGRLVVEQGKSQAAVEPLAIFAELVNIGDLIHQTIHVFFEEELVVPRIVQRADFATPSVNAKRKFEQLLDNHVADGLNTGIDVLMDQVDFILMTEQLGSDYSPVPGTPPIIGPTNASKKVVTLIKSHVQLLVGSTEKLVLEVFEQEIGLRLYSSIGKHIKRSSISVDGAVTLISDINYYYDYILSRKQKRLYPYFESLKQMSQLYLIDTSNGKQLGIALSDMTRFKGVMPPDELVEFMERRSDWPLVRAKVEKVLYGFGECILS